MKNVDIWEWDVPIIQILGLALIFISVTFVILRILSGILCRKRSTEPEVLPSSLHISCRYNQAFDYDEISASRIEERRCKREARLHCENPYADVTLDRIDRSIGAALAVEQLLRDSYIFDTRVMSRPSGNVRVVAARRDYI